MITTHDVMNEYPCLVCQTKSRERFGHHWPRQKGMGGNREVTDGLLEVVPLCWICHGRFHDGDDWTIGMVARYGAQFQFDVYRTYRLTTLYMGPEWRVREVMESY